ncbi:unnamed protein product [Ilex paraguariensis]|uniref:Uncharacterized protein n=1 Tax=Ilex paraguariensis TaxID=185542 RepID=A0ABC8SNR2_9AQUA
MSTTHGYMAFIYILLLLSPLGGAMAGRVLNPSVTVRTKLSESKAHDFVALKPELNHRGNVFHSREVKSCMPKGSGHSSAPSRYVNYHTLRSMGCSPGKNSRKP